MSSRDPDFDIADFGFEEDINASLMPRLLRGCVTSPGRMGAALYWRLTGRKVRARNVFRSVVGERLRVLDEPAPPRVPLPEAGLRAARIAVREISEANLKARSSDAELLILLREGAALAPQAEAVFASGFAKNPQWQAAYADELARPSGGGLTVPLFKPDFDEELLLALDYIGPGLAVRKDTFAALGGLDPQFTGSELREIVFRACRAYGAQAIGHIAEPLVHWRADGSGAERTGRLAATRAHLTAVHDMADSELETATGLVHVRRKLPVPLPLVTVIVPTRDRLDLLRPCLAGVLQRTGYPALEAIVADNGSRDPSTRAYFDEIARDGRVRILPHPGPFNFSAINNAAAQAARGAILVFLNNDIEVIEAHWLRAMVAQAVRPGVGAVGAKLLYPDGKVQHGGVVLGIKGIAAHAHQFFPGDHPGYMHRLRAAQHFAAVTAACLAVSREKFLKVGGFNAGDFPVSLNDVDLCLKLEAAGFPTLWTPEAVLLHKESASRRKDRTASERARWLREVATFKERWKERIARDGCYNPNLGDREADFAIRRPVSLR